MSNPYNSNKKKTNIFIKAIKKSPWIFHLSAGSCNNCDIELLDCLTPKYDVERFGILKVGSVRHADIIVVTGIVNQQTLPRLLRIYEEAPKPCFVVALGTCACSGNIFRDSYHFAGPVDKIIPVSAYIPGCPPKPEAIINGLVSLLKLL